MNVHHMCPYYCSTGLCDFFLGGWIVGVVVSPPAVDSPLDATKWEILKVLGTSLFMLFTLLAYIFVQNLVTFDKNMSCKWLTLEDLIVLCNCNLMVCGWLMLWLYECVWNASYFFCYSLVLSVSWWWTDNIMIDDA